METAAIFAPVINDFRNWYNAVSPYMNTSERDDCEDLTRTIDMPPSAWERPHKHPLYAKAIRNNGRHLSVGVFYFLRLIYIDHFSSLVSSVKREKPHDAHYNVNPDRVRSRFVNGTLVKLAQARYKFEVLWRDPEELPGHFSKLLLQDQAGQMKESQKGKDEPIDLSGDQKRRTLPLSRNIEGSDFPARRSSRRRAYRQGMYMGMDPGKGDNIYRDLEEPEVDANNDLQEVDCIVRSVEHIKSQVEPQRGDRKDTVGGSLDANTESPNCDAAKDAQGFGMKISDQELMDRVTNQLKEDGTWEWLQQPTSPPKTRTHFRGWTEISS